MPCAFYETKYWAFLADRLTNYIADVYVSVSTYISVTINVAVVNVGAQ